MAEQKSATPLPPPPSMSLLHIGDQAFEINHGTGQIKPYGDKPTSDQMNLATSLEYLLPRLNQHWNLSNTLQQGQADQKNMGKNVLGSMPQMEGFQYTPLAGSRLYHGIYTMDKQKWMESLMKELALPFTPSMVEPNPSIPGAWNVQKPGSGDWEIYK